MRVLLIYPNRQGERVTIMDRAAVAEPLALEYVAAAAKLDGHEVKLLDLRLHVTALDRTLTAFRPDVVGLTGFTMHVLRNLEIAARVRELRPDCRIVVGGLHATFEPVDFFEPQIDYILPGEGVRAFRRLLGCLAKGYPVKGLPGVYARTNGRFRLGGRTETDLDTCSSAGIRFPQTCASVCTHPPWPQHCRRRQ